jgi:hypothetical protein
LFAARRAFRRRIHSALTSLPAAHASEKRLVKVAPALGSVIVSPLTEPICTNRMGAGLAGFGGGDQEALGAGAASL